MRLNLSFLVFLFLATVSWTQDDSLEEPSNMGESLRFRIETRFITEQRQIDWSNQVDQDTLSGEPVVVRIQGDNFLLKVTLTGYSRDESSLLLVAQTEVVFQDGSRKALNKSLLSQVVRLGNPVVYFPMGKDRKSSEGHSMEMEILITAKEALEAAP